MPVYEIINNICESGLIMTKAIVRNKRCCKLLCIGTLLGAGVLYVHEKRLAAVEAKYDELEDKVKRISNELSYLKGDEDLDA